jgi:hypothetical protein
MTEAVARVGVAAKEVRRALMLHGELAARAGATTSG